MMKKQIMIAILLIAQSSIGMVPFVGEIRGNMEDVLNLRNQFNYTIESATCIGCGICMSVSPNPIIAGLASVTCITNNVAKIYSNGCRCESSEECLASPETTNIAICLYAAGTIANIHPLSCGPACIVTGLVNAQHAVFEGECDDCFSCCEHSDEASLPVPSALAMSAVINAGYHQVPSDDQV